MIYKRDNVERVVEDKAAAARLEQLGFVCIDGTASETEEIAPAQKKELEELTIQELRSMAKTRGIKGASALSKKDLIQVLQ